MQDSHVRVTVCRGTGENVIGFMGILPRKWRFKQKNILQVKWRLRLVEIYDVQAQLCGR